MAMSYDSDHAEPTSRHATEETWRSFEKMRFLYSLGTWILERDPIPNGVEREPQNRRPMLSKKRQFELACVRAREFSEYRSGSVGPLSRPKCLESDLLLLLSANTNDSL